MAIKNLGHYEGTIDDIYAGSPEFNKLNSVHQKLIILSKEKKGHSDRINEIDESIRILKSTIEPLVHEKKINWAWYWYKKTTSVKWKQEFVKLLGNTKAKQVFESYKQKKHIQIGIKYIDPSPESIIQIKENPKQFPVLRHRLKLKQTS